MDLAPCPTPSHDPRAFMAQPIVTEGGDVHALVALEFPLQPVNAIMHSRVGMGKTGDTLLIGPDYLMRSDSYLNPSERSISASFRNPQSGKMVNSATQRCSRTECSRN